MHLKGNIWGIKMYFAFCSMFGKFVRRFHFLNQEFFRFQLFWLGIWNYCTRNFLRDKICGIKRDECIMNIFRENENFPFDRIRKKSKPWNLHANLCSSLFSACLELTSCYVEIIQLFSSSRQLQSNISKTNLQIAQKL